MALKLDPMRVAPAVTAIYRLWSASLRYSHQGREAVNAALEGGESLVFAIWHNELFSGVALRGDLPLVGVVSQSKDGEFLAQVLERLGVATARGSSSRGGLKALVRAIRFMRQGRHAVFTVDGPRGPRHKVKEGVIYLAHKAGARIVPVRAHARRKFVFHKAWDRFELPLPLTRVRVAWGEPYALDPGDMDKDRMAAECLALEEKLNALD